MPWWHLTESVAPTHLWLGSDEVQEIDVSPETFFELTVNGTPVGVFATEPYYGDFEGAYPEPSAANVEAALELAYGGGNVRVTGGPGGTAPLVVTSVNADAGQAVEELSVTPVIGGAKTKVLTEGGSGVLRVRAFNLGGTDLEGTAARPVTISDRLPAGVLATSITAKNTYSAAPLKCEQATVSCTYEETLAPYGSLELVIHVSLAPSAKAGIPQAMTGEENAVTASGGDAPAASVEEPITVSDVSTPFGVAEYASAPEAEGGAPDTQAGSHPFQFTTTLTFDESRESPNQPAQPRDLRFDLPAGLVGNATSLPQCKPTDFNQELQPSWHNSCPADTAIGVAAVTVHILPYEPPVVLLTPVYNLVPPRGEPAQFGFGVAGSTVVLNTAVRPDGAVTVSVDEAPQAVAVISSVVTLWGDPGSQAHNASRGWSCLYPEPAMEAAVGSCDKAIAPAQSAFLRLPTACTGPLQSPMAANSWADKSFLEVSPSFASASLDGCEALPFGPELKLESSAHTAYTPTSLAVRLQVPQEASEAPEGVAESDVKNTVVTLPAGFQINPAAAAGLQGCTEGDIGFEKYDETTKQTFFEEETEQERLGEAQHKECPEGSKLGTVKITTPLLSEPLEGAVYQAAQEENPFGSVLALYVVAESRKYGVRVRLAGEVKVNHETGQIVSTFDHTPQLPFEEFDLKFFGGSQGPITTTGCGSYRTETSIEPWSGGATASPFSEFDMSSGPGGTACPDPGPFAPSFVAGTQNNDAGAFSPFTLNITRKDGEQSLSTVALKLPPGLSGVVSSVTLCPEAQANAGNCPAASKIGHVRVSAGVGSEPIVLPEAGKPEDPVYLTGPYKGAPFGLSVVVPAEAGPFNLDEGGHPIVVRAKVEVDPHTGQVSVLSDPMPTRLQGIPLDVRDVEVVVDKPDFTFNPTNCEPLSVTGMIGSSESASANVSSHFQATNCATLKFQPKFAVSSQAHTSKADGASLHVSLSYPAGALGTEANMHEVKVELPKRLPSRLTTLQKACTAAQFDANPAGCPAASIVGHAKAITPILPVPLEGPAYFVSHGGEAFPNLTMVLQGYGVTVELVGDTFISKAGITSSTFKTVPDVPVSSFELTLPEGPYSALTANGNLCKKALKMPTEMVGQNGAVIHQRTKLSVSGCKPALDVVGHRVHGSIVTVQVKVPAAGTLTAHARGLTKARKRPRRAKLVTVKLKLSKGERAFLARHHGRRLKTTIHLRFAPRHGTKLAGNVTVLIR